MRIVAGVATDIGRVREGNEDSFLVEPPLYAVADGMGGARGGEVASQLALSTLEEGFLDGRGPLRDLVLEANAAVYARSVEDRSVAGMGTTLTAVLVDGAMARLVHVGDSRAYLLRAGDLRQITDDHTLVQRMIRAGEITAEEADVHPHRNVLLRVLGTEPAVDVDERDVGLLEGDRMVLCSDGLTGMITEDQLQAILEAAAEPQDAAERLIRAANHAGGIDNITVVVLDVVEGEPADDVAARAATVRKAGGLPTSRPTGSDGQPPAGSRRSLLRIAFVVLATLVVLIVAYSAMRAWLDSRWYVGVANGHVAIYQGIPATVLGLRLSDVDLETDLSALKVERLPLYADLASGINVDSREEALARIDQMRTDVATAEGTGQVAGTG